MYYYGARYYDPRTSVWLGVDPMSDKYPSLSPFAYCADNPIMLIDPDGRDWAEVETSSGKDVKKEIQWFDSKKAFEKSGQKGTYLGKAAVVFNGSRDEKLGDDNTLTGQGAKAADVTVYGTKGKDDIQSYKGLSVSSDPSKYSMVDEGWYNAKEQQMANSPYGKDSKNYRLSTLDGNLAISGSKGGKAKQMTEIFFHRTDWNGKADKSSHGCPVIDGRQWNRLEKQLSGISEFKLKIAR
jgi:hypothetical protein